MGGRTTAPPSPMDSEGDLIAAIRGIVKALEQKTDLTPDARKVLSDLGSQLITISTSDESKNQDSEENKGELVEIQHHLNEIQDKVMNWEKDQSMIFDCGPDEAYEYLKSMEETQRLIETLENTFPNTSTSSTLLREAHDLLQTGMSRLEEEFRYLLVSNRQSFEPEQVSFRSNEDDIIEAGSVISSGDDSVEDAVVHRDSVGHSSEECIIELINQDVISDLKNIVNLMFSSNYGHECSQAFVNVQKDALDDCLFILEVEKLSIEDVLKMEWKLLNSKVRRWMRAMKPFVRVYLASEKILTDQIFGDLGSVGSSCFAEASKPAILQLLNFGEAISIGPHQPEKLIRILDMHEVLAGLIPDITSLYSEDGPGSCVRTECHDVLKRLGDCARVTFIEFENAVSSNVSASAFAGGGVHHLTRYVMNYIRTLMDYSKTLDEVLKGDVPDEDQEEDPNMSPVSEDENTVSNRSPMSKRFRSLISSLERNLDTKSNLYREESLQHLFMMNNVHYMAEKVKNSELRMVLGDEWIRKHNWKFQQLAMNYERATWSSMLNFLREEGIQNPGSNSKTRAMFKERLQSFYLAFEEVYKNQTGWSIPDGSLRDDLRISASLKVIQAYRTFVGRHVNHISERHIKYTADDLEDYLLHFFEGSQRSLHGGHKK